MLCFVEAKTERFMGGSTFFFVESKAFEFSVEEGGTFYSLRIIEKGRDSSRFVTLGKKSAKRLLFNVEELASKQSPVQFSRTFREGNKIFIIQLGSNASGNFLLVFELIHGRRKGSIVILEGKLGKGWGGFGLHLRKTLEDSLLRQGHSEIRNNEPKHPTVVVQEGQ